MFSPNQLYDYLRYYCHSNKKNATIRNFTVDGSKLLMDLSPSQSPFVPHNDAIDNINEYDISNEEYRLNSGCIDMYDQEPIDIQAYYDTTIKQMNKSAFRMKFNTNDFVFSNSMGLYNPIVFHSEKNSNEVIAFSNNFHIPAYYWTNAITSRYWFSHFELLRAMGGDNRKRFGIYIRDVSGTREYRKDIINHVNNSKIDVFCPMLDGETFESDASASIEWGDHNKFDIQIVPETLFNTEKIHLTEKVFKPMIMYQSFILFAGANSLKYIRDYGFKTFGDIWDESYDDEIDSSIRLNKLLNLIDYISNLPTDEYNKLIKKTESIIQHNRTHFYSNVFKHKLLNELNGGMEEAVALQEESFFTSPGGTLFHYCNLYDRGSRRDEFKKFITPSLHKALKYTKSKSESVNKDIIKKYSHLL